MKPLYGLATSLLLSAVLAGCMTTGETDTAEQSLGKREQTKLLARAVPVAEYGLSPSFPFGNGTIYLGGTLLEPNQTSGFSYRAGDMPIIGMQTAARNKPFSVLLDTASNASWMQYPCARENGYRFLSNKGMIIPYIGTASTEGVDTFAGIIPEMKMGSIMLNKTPLFVRMATGQMSPVVYSSAEPRVDAVLGWDNLRQFQIIKFDLANGQVALSSSQVPYMPDQERLIGRASISRACTDKLAVEGAIQSLQTPIILDFCGDYGLARADTRDPETKQLELGEVVFLNAPTKVLAVQDRIPRAGRKLLEKYVVTICPRMGVVYFERPLNVNGSK
ncbi:MAG: hypothetical protein JXR25_02060 [Pontiellaceae bacterium]|nr:hypothetical protein [Pontiellaceae bacterium]MBN2783584.1 hypothetical protein [Pontiellaceae bacterium]